MPDADLDHRFPNFTFVMMYLCLYQIAPPLALAALYLWLERYPAFGRYSLRVIFALGAALQLALWAKSHPNLDNPDSLGFFQLGHGQTADLRLILFRPKLYPIFLSFFATPKAAAFVQCVIKLTICLWIPRLGGRLGWRPAITAWAATLYLTNALWLVEPLKILDTTLYAALFTSALCLAWENLLEFSPRGLFALAVTGGLASLTRQVGDATLLIIALALMLRAYRRVAARPRLFAGAWLVALLLANAGGLWNGIHYRVFQRTVALGISMYTHLSFYELHEPGSPEWDWVEQSLPGERARLGAWDTQWRAQAPWAVNALPHLLERARGVDDVPAILARDREFRERFRVWGMTYPACYATSVGNELQRLLWKCEEIYPQLPFAGWQRAEPAGQGTLYVTAKRIWRGLSYQTPGWLLLLATAGWIFAARGKTAFGVLLVGLAGYFLLIASVQIGFTRYALPTLPVLYALCAQALESLIRFREQWLRYLPAWLRPKAMAAKPNPATKDR